MVQVVLPRQQQRQAPGPQAWRHRCVFCWACGDPVNFSSLLSHTKYLGMTVILFFSLLNRSCFLSVSFVFLFPRACVEKQVTRQDHPFSPPQSSIAQPNPSLSLLQPSGSVIPPMSAGLDPNDASLDLEPIPLNDSHPFSTPTPPPAQQPQPQPQQQPQVLLRQHQVIHIFINVEFLVILVSRSEKCSKNVRKVPRIICKLVLVCRD